MYSVDRFNEDRSPGDNRSGGEGVPSLLNFVDEAGRCIREALGRSGHGRRHLLVDRRRYIQRQLRCRHPHRLYTNPRLPIEPGNCADRYIARVSCCVDAKYFSAELERPDKQRQFASYQMMTKAMLDSRVSSTQPEANASSGNSNGACANESRCHRSTAVANEAAHDSGQMMRDGNSNGHSRGPSRDPQRDEDLADRTKKITQSLSGSEMTATSLCYAKSSATNIVRSDIATQKYQVSEITNNPKNTTHSATTETTSQPLLSGNRNDSFGDDGNMTNYLYASGNDHGFKVASRHGEAMFSGHYSNKTEPGNGNNSEIDSSPGHRRKQVPLRQRPLPASFWKEPNVPKLRQQLPPEYIAAAFYGTRKYGELSAHALSPSQLYMLAYKDVSAYSCSGAGINGYPVSLPDCQRPYALATEQCYNVLESRYSPEFYASLYAAAADTATWTPPGDRKSPITREKQRSSCAPPTLVDCGTGKSNRESSRHQHVWKPVATKSIVTSLGTRFHPFDGVR